MAVKCSHLFLLVTLHAVHRTSGEIFSSIAQMETMISSERTLSHQVDLYTEAQEDRLKTINRYVEKLSTLSHVATDQESILHPVVAFLHTVALSKELNEIVNFLVTYKEPEIHLHSMLLHRSSNGLPDGTDLTGTVAAIERLRDIYELKASHFADGRLVRQMDIIESHQPTLSVTDCYVIASELFTAEFYKASSNWFALVVDRCTNTSSSEIAAEDCSLDMIATSLARWSYVEYLSGDTATAILQAAEALTFSRTCVEAVKYLKTYFASDDGQSSEQSSESEAQVQYDEAEQQRRMKEDDPKNYYGQFDHTHLSSLCRGDTNREAELDKHLRCIVTTNGSPYLRLQPIKVEELDNAPEIKIFHNFATADELAALIPLGLQTLQRARMVGLDNLTNEGQEAYDLESVTHSRTAKNTWITHDYNEVTEAITRRVQAATGLSVQDGHGEPLQLANYGIGGHYIPHFDFFSINHSRPESGTKPADERIATFMLYLSDVEAGGATVFLGRNLTVWPKRGDALFWYNLHRDGHGNRQTLHAGCPVLTGSKWVMNLWITARGQELRRPCHSAPDNNLF